MQPDTRHRASRIFRGRTYGHRTLALVAAFSVGAFGAACTGEVVEPDGMGSGAAGSAGIGSPTGGSGGAIGTGTGTGTGTGAGGSNGTTTGAGGTGVGGSGTGGTGGSAPRALAPDEILLQDGVTIVKFNPTAAGPRALTRLTRREYNNTVRDLLGDTTKPANEFPNDKPDNFMFPRVDVVATQDAELLGTAAGSLAAAATAATKLNALVGCTTADEACARTFVKNFGLKAYRRPVTVAETDRLIALYTKVRGLSLTFGDAINMMLQAMLQSPAFLYHWERAPDEAATREGALVKLSPYETASRLSYFIWGSMPDDKLLQAAAANQLGTQAEIEAQAARLLADPKSQDTVAAFFNDLLELELLHEERPKDVVAYPASIYPAATIVADLQAETAAFTKNVVFQGDGKLSTLLSADYSFLNASLAKIYGATAQGTALTKVTLKPTERTGLLTQAGFLAATGATDTSHPVRRGKFVVTRLLCMDLPPPPDVVPQPASADKGGTTRKRYEDHGKLACTGACHQMMDPIGYAFEHYDGIGRYRTLDNKEMVNAATTVPLDGKDIQVADATALAKVLASSPTVQNCMATQFVRFALGRNETEADYSAIAHARAAFAKNGAKIQDLMVGIASSRSFQYRTPASDEVLP